MKVSNKYDRQEQDDAMVATNPACDNNKDSVAQPSGASEQQNEDQQQQKQQQQKADDSNEAKRNRNNDLEVGVVDVSTNLSDLSGSTGEVGHNTSTNGASKQLSSRNADSKEFEILIQAKHAEACKAMGVSYVFVDKYVVAFGLMLTNKPSQFVYLLLLLIA